MCIFYKLNWKLSKLEYACQNRGGYCPKESATTASNRKTFNYETSVRNFKNSIREIIFQLKTTQYLFIVAVTIPLMLIFIFV